MSFAVHSFRPWSEGKKAGHTPSYIPVVPTEVEEESWPGSFKIDASNYYSCNISTIYVPEEESSLVPAPRNNFHGTLVATPTWFVQFLLILGLVFMIELVVLMAVLVSWVWCWN